MTLLTAPQKMRVTLSRGAEAAGLEGLGLCAGDEAVVVGAAPFGGPLLVELPRAGVRLALGRQRAALVRVEPLVATVLAIAADRLGRRTG
jgi:Fe2+ transport system protein FeoA